MMHEETVGDSMKNKMAISNTKKKWFNLRLIIITIKWQRIMEIPWPLEVAGDWKLKCWIDMMNNGKE